MLGMFDTKPDTPVLAIKQPVKDIKHFPVGPVANGMNSNLKSMLIRLVSNITHDFDWHGWQAHIARPVTIGFKQPGTA